MTTIGGRPAPYTDVDRCAKGAPLLRIQRLVASPLEPHAYQLNAPAQANPFAVDPGPGELPSVETTVPSAEAAGICQEEIAPGRYALFLSFPDAETARRAVGTYRPSANPPPPPTPHSDALPTIPVGELPPSTNAASYLLDRVRRFPDEAQSWYQLASTYLGRELFAEAMTAARRAVDLNPNEVDYQAMVAEIAFTLYATLGRHQTSLPSLLLAIDAMEASVALAPDDAMALINLGNMYAERGALENARAANEHALDIFHQALGIEPNNVHALTGVGLMELRLKHLEMAERAFTSALRIDPKNMTALANLALVDLENGLPKEAITALLSLLERAPRDASAWANLGTAFLILDEHAQAERAYAAALSLYGPYAPLSVHVDRAEALRHQNDFAGAILEIEATLEREPENAHLWLELGDLHRLLGQPARARFAFQRALDRAPENPSTLLLFGHFLAAEFSEYAESNDLLMRAVAQEPNNTQAMEWIITNALLADDPRTALEYGRRLMAISLPGSTATLRSLAILFEASGDAELLARVQETLAQYEAEELTRSDDDPEGGDDGGGAAPPANGSDPAPSGPDGGWLHGPNCFAGFAEGEPVGAALDSLLPLLDATDDALTPAWEIGTRALIGGAATPTTAARPRPVAR